MVSERNAKRTGGRRWRREGRSGGGKEGGGGKGGGEGKKGGVEVGRKEVVEERREKVKEGREKVEEGREEVEEGRRRWRRGGSGERGIKKKEKAERAGKRWTEEDFLTSNHSLPAVEHSAWRVLLTATNSHQLSSSQCEDCLPHRNK